MCRVGADNEPQHANVMLTQRGKLCLHLKAFIQWKSHMRFNPKAQVKGQSELQWMGGVDLWIYIIHV